MERWEVLESIHGGVFVTPDFSFGEDALALARFAAPAAGRVCELGTGCGVIALLLARDAAAVSAVEIQPQAAALAARSVAENGLADTVQVICADWNDFAGATAAGTFDCVVCNPPYFAAGSGNPSVSAARRIARHEPDEGALLRLANAAARLLKQGGRFCVCHRPERLCDLLAALRSAGLEPKRLAFLRHTPGGAPWLCLCEAVRGGRPGLKIL